MKRFIFISLFITLFFNGIVKAETPRFVNAEFLGVHNLIGFSYDTRFSEKSKYGVKIGLGYGFEDSKRSLGGSFEFGGKNANFRTSPVGFLRGRRLKNVLSAPISLYRLFGRKKKFFELGIGVVPYYAEYKENINIIFDLPNITLETSPTENQFRYYGLLQTAYRYQGEKVLISAGIDIPLNTPGADFIQLIGLYPRLSVGYKF